MASLLVRLIFALVVVGISGCASVTKQSKKNMILDASQEGQVEGTGMSSADIRTMAERAATEITAWLASQKKQVARIALLDVDNQTLFALNPNVIKDRLLADLVEFSQDKGLDFSESSVGADYFLRVQITSLNKGSTEGANTYMLYTFKLIDRTDTVKRVITYETKKQGKVAPIYR
jgi:hypothetical protein